MNEDRLRSQLRAAPIDGAREAEERSWRVVQAAYAERPTSAHLPSARRVVVALAAGALALAIGFSPAGAKVGEWIDDLVDPGVRNTEPALTGLPAPGSLLVTSEQGPWVVHADGSKRLLGAYEQASWSPNGLFVIAARGRELTAVTPTGEVRWSLGSEEPVSDPRWAPSGYRIAYRSGSALRVVTGDGSADTELVDRIADVAPAWRPSSDADLQASPTGVGTHLLAFSDPDGRVALIDADSGEIEWRSDAGPVPTELEWSAEGTILFALQRNSLRLFDRFGFIGKLPAPTEGRLTSVAASPLGTSYALVATHRGPDGRERSEVQLVEGAGKGPVSELFAGPGRFGPVAFSPDGRWLLVPWQSADQWLFLPIGDERGGGRITAVDGISREFDPGGTGSPAFPRVEGWCC